MKNEQDSILRTKNRLSERGRHALKIGQGLFHGSMSVFPLYLTSKSKLDYLPYAIAVKEDAVRVTEIGNSGRVPELFFENTGKEKVFVMDGEHLVGAKQNRIINTSIMVEAGTKLIIPVTCVEQGRWHYNKSQDMSAHDSSLYAATRAAKAQTVHSRLEKNNRYEADQSAIWNDISTRLSEENISSQTYAMEDHYNARRDSLESYQKAFNLKRFEKKERHRMVGAVFGIAGEILGFDAFDKDKTLDALWSKILNSYAFEAIRVNSKKKVKSEDVKAFLKSAFLSDMTLHEPPGIGEDVRMRSNSIVGGCLIVEGVPVHVFCFKSPTQSIECEAADNEMIQSYKARRMR